MKYIRQLIIPIFIFLFALVMYFIYMKQDEDNMMLIILGVSALYLLVRFLLVQRNLRKK
ncbi:MAG: hypothetical protein PHP31_01920 [Lentimicrobiaceae bacterium]|nr:hypothetical protein [Lentimicrobiaceae bacterium]